MASNSDHSKPNRPDLHRDLFGEPASGSEGFDFKKRTLPEEEVQQATEQLSALLQSDTRRGTTRHSFVRKYYWAAASVVLLLIGTVVYWILYAGSEVVYTTAFGETQHIILPDESTVLLNANSTLRYDTLWTDERSREVWLEGEAFFSVLEKPAPAHRKFVVHTADLDVEVVGTQFNVNNREEKTEVVLNTGSVRLNLARPGAAQRSAAQPGAAQQEVLMQPGELVIYTPKTQKYVRQQVNPEVRTAWRNKLLVFENQPLQEIAATLQNTYGITLRFASDAIARKRFTATVPADQVEVLITMLSSSFSVERKKNVITLKPPGR